MQTLRQALAFSMVFGLGASALWTIFGSHTEPDPKPIAWAIVYAAIVVFILVLTMDADDYTGESNG